MNDFLKAANLLFREDARKIRAVKGESSSPSTKKKLRYNPAQKRGKDGRWVETGAENRNKAKAGSEKQKLSVERNDQVILDKANSWNESYDLIDERITANGYLAAIGRMGEKVQGARGNYIYLNPHEKLTPKASAQIESLNKDAGKVEFVKSSPNPKTTEFRDSEKKLVGKIKELSSGVFLLDVDGTQMYASKSKEEVETEAKKILESYSKTHRIKVTDVEKVQSTMRSDVEATERKYKEYGLDKVDPDIINKNQLIIGEIKTKIKFRQDHPEYQEELKGDKYLGVTDKKGNLQSVAKYEEKDGGVYVDLVATAPWNLVDSHPKKTKGAGATAVATIIKDAGADKKLSLHALEKAVGFYEKLGFQAKGSLERELIYMESDPDNNKRIVEKYG